MSEHYEPGQVLGEKYRILSTLGQGGMGVVYQVEDTFLQRELALKTIDRAAVSAVAIRRFQAEARATYSLNHPNIISVNDFGIFPDGTPFLAMELIAGETISDILKRRTFAEREALAIFIQVCEGLRHAHDNGVVHRDIKPSNIMLLAGKSPGTESSVKILDFGIAKLTQNDGGEIQALTRTGEIFGSPLYMSPEQSSGINIDHRTDIYSLGCVLFEALTGTPPYVGENALSTMMRHKTAEVPSLREASLGKKFSPGIEEIVKGMLGKSAAERYQSIAEVEKDLRSLSSLNPVSNSTTRSTFHHTTRAIVDKSLITLSRTAFGASVIAVAVSASLLTASALTLYSSTKKVAPGVAGPDYLGPDVPTDGTHEFDKGINSKAVKFEINVAADDESLNSLGKYKDVQQLEINDGDLSPTALSKIAHEPLISLTVKRSGIKSLAPIANIKTLQDLSVQGSDISKSDLEIIAKLPSLHMVNLNECIIPQDQIKTLLKSNSLAYISLSESSRGKYPRAFVEELRKAMPYCAILQHGEEAEESLIDSETKAILDPIERLRKQVELSKKANPNLSSTANYEVALALALYPTNKKEALKFSDDAIAVCNANHNNAVLVGALGLSGMIERELGNVARADKLRLEAFDLAKKYRFWDEGEIFDISLRAMEASFKTNKPKFCEVADFIIDIGTRFPNVNAAAVAQAMDTAGWQSLLANDVPKEIKYFDQEVAFTTPLKEHSLAFKRLYARALASRARIVRPEQKQYLQDAIKEIDALNLPDELMLLENYTDCCVLLADIYDNKDHDLAEATMYDKLALRATGKMKTHPGLHASRKAKEQGAATSLAARLRQAGKNEEAAQVEAKYSLKRQGGK